MQCSFASRFSRCINPYVARCWFVLGSRHEVYHLYIVFRQAIERWLSLRNSPGLGMSVVFPSENHKGNWYSSRCAVAWKLMAIVIIIVVVVVVVIIIIIIIIMVVFNISKNSMVFYVKCLQLLTFADFKFFL